MDNPKPQLHVSMLDMIAKCGIQFQRRYGARFDIWPKEEIIPPSIALTIGNTCHDTIENYLNYKIEMGNIPSAESIKDIAATIYAGHTTGEMKFDEDEQINPERALGMGKDMAISLSLLHHQLLGPIIQPAAVEEKFVITLNGFPFDLAGKKDIRETNGDIRDTKTSAQAGKNQPISMQMAMYSVAEKIERGQYPGKVKIDSLIKTKVPKLETLEAVPDPVWIDPLFRRIERFAEIIDAVQSGKQALMPADPTHWCCQSRFCGYAKSCKYWSRRI